MSETLEQLREWRETIADSIARMDSGETDNGIMGQIRAQQHDTLDKTIQELEALHKRVNEMDTALKMAQKSLEWAAKVDDELAALKKAQREPAAEVVESVESDRYFKCDVLSGTMPAVGTKLYLSAAAVPDAHELWAAAQLVPGEGIEDGVDRIEALLSAAEQNKAE